MAESDERKSDPEFCHRLANALEGDFEVGELVGTGGFAEVYAARDMHLERDVAIKTLRSDLHASPKIRERFLREARTVAQLRHPNVLPVYAVGERDGIGYFVMPLVDGESLQDYLERTGPVPVDEARRLIMEIGDALGHAHSKGLVHRDVKPDNVMLEGPERRALVMDFGIAKAVEVHEPKLTGTGMVVGTPLYMSPEQACGDPVDHRSDIYSLGVIAFELLAARPPFVSGSVQAVIAMHVMQDPPALSKLRPDCPPDLSAAVHRCLEKTADRRFESAAELSRILRGEPASVVPNHARAKEPSKWRLPGSLGVGAALLSVTLYVVGASVVIPFVFAVAALIGLLILGQSKVPGYGDVVFGAPNSGTVRLSGTHRAGSLDAVQQARSERAAVAAIVRSMPRSQTERLPDVRHLCDVVVARVIEIGRRRDMLDRLATPASGRATRVAPRLDKAEVDSQITRLEAEARDLADGVVTLRMALEQTALRGVSMSGDQLTGIVSELEARVGPRENA